MAQNNSRAGKRPINLTISAKLLDEARNLKINLSQTLDQCSPLRVSKDCRVLSGATL